jgi:methylenetetrahydrofolate dehydrogenase (NADP+)/methenyltetrahydrofolate cyclohydrolase
MLLYSKPLVEERKKEIKKRALEFKMHTGYPPGLAVILIGEDPASTIYTTRKAKFAKQCELYSEVFKFDANIDVGVVKNKIAELNESRYFHGILIQRPLPQHFKEHDVIWWVDPNKDVDGFHPIQVARRELGLPGALLPCTPLGILNLLKHYNVSVASQLCVVVGRSQLVGKPLAHLLLDADATVVQCHSKTKNLEQLTSQADFLFIAVGIPNMIKFDHVKKNSVIIDVGINKSPSGEILGDVDFTEVFRKAKAITPVPGGVGPMTVLELLSNTIKSSYNLIINYNY